MHNYCQSNSVDQRISNNNNINTFQSSLPLKSAKLKNNDNFMMKVLNNNTNQKIIKKKTRPSTNEFKTDISSARLNQKNRKS